MTEYWSFILAPFGLIGLWMSGSRNRWGWALSIGTQVLWLTYAIQTQQWGFVPGSLAYGCIYARNFIRWSKPTDVPPAEDCIIDQRGYCVATKHRTNH